MDIKIKVSSKDPLSVDNYYKRGYTIIFGEKKNMLSLASCFISYDTAQLLESGEQEKIREGLERYKKWLKYQLEILEEL